jgi:hypothetical protein
MKKRTQGKSKQKALKKEERNRRGEGKVSVLVRGVAQIYE